MSYLVVPRVLACTIMVPVLTIYANVISLVGGAMAAVAQVGITMQLYTNSVVEYVAAEDFVSGVFKAVVFGMIVGVVGCYKGLSCGRGAEGVGRGHHGSRGVDRHHGPREQLLPLPSVLQLPQRHGRRIEPGTSEE